MGGSLRTQKWVEPIRDTGLQMMLERERKKGIYWGVEISTRIAQERPPNSWLYHQHWGGAQILMAVVPLLVVGGGGPPELRWHTVGDD